jgi:cytosine/adenosine deaminase-related metal-dependent hydrolase
MVLSNVRLIDGGAVVSIGISGGKITSLQAVEEREPQFTFSGAVAFPGLINSHDHLDFNLFPQLGDKIYDNYVEWGDYIQDNYKDEIDAVLKIPQNLRTQWGIYKNLLCGVTTVVNHGVDLAIDDPLIRVFNRCQNLHSVAREKYWRLRLNNPLKVKIPAVIHIGEGSDIGAFTEINELLRWTLLHRDLIAVHGVAMKPSQAADFKALVWCPQSNYFLLNKTAHIDQLKRHTQILFGTDSTLTSTWDAWDHIRMAQKTNLLTDGELYDSLTINPAKVWKLNSGKIAPGKTADIVIAKDKGGFCTTECTDLLMVIHEGNIRLFDEEMYGQVCNGGIDVTAYTKVYLGDSCKYVQGDLPGLMGQIQQHHPAVQFPVSLQQYTAVH